MSTDLHEDTDDLWISQAEGARLRGVSRQAIAQLVRRGRLTTRIIAGRVLIRRDELEAFQPRGAGRPPLTN